MSEDDIVIETTAGGYMSLFDAYNMADVVAKDYKSETYKVLGLAHIGGAAAAVALQDMFPYFAPSLAPAWPSMCVTHRVLASEPELPRIVTTTRVSRELLRKPYKPRHTHKVATRAGKQHRIKGAR